LSFISVWLSVGLEHILSLDGYDHILFILSLCLSYSLTNYKKLLLVVTGFTLGHSLTLLLSTLSYIKINNQLIEILIPVTIVISAIRALKSKNNLPIGTGVTMATFFGLIHGCGFSNSLRSLLGHEQQIIFPLLYFNVGIEIGQLIIVLLYFLILQTVTRFTKVNVKNLSFSAMILIFVASVVLLLQRISLLF